LVVKEPYPLAANDHLWRMRLVVLHLRARVPNAGQAACGPVAGGLRGLNGLSGVSAGEAGHVGGLRVVIEAPKVNRLFEE